VPALDVLVLAGFINRSGMQFERAKGRLGMELTLATNHLGQFFLVHALRSLFTNGTRIVVVTSPYHFAAPGAGVPVDVEDARDINFFKQHSRKVEDPVATRWLQLSDEGAKTDGWSGFAAFASSKLGNILFAHELARRMGKDGVRVVIASTGFVWNSNNLANMWSKWIRVDGIVNMFEWISPTKLATHPRIGFLWSPDDVAHTVLHAAIGQTVAEWKTATPQTPALYLVPQGTVGTHDPRGGNRSLQKAFWKMSAKVVNTYTSEILVSKVGHGVSEVIRKRGISSGRRGSEVFDLVHRNLVDLMGIDEEPLDKDGLKEAAARSTEFPLSNGIAHNDLESLIHFFVAMHDDSFEDSVRSIN
jgi:NAD(P)-dependent dehydrogenase (short-subunit alcohol dehydrogenase family)